MRLFSTFCAVRVVWCIISQVFGNLLYHNKNKLNVITVLHIATTGGNPDCNMQLRSNLVQHVIILTQCMNIHFLNVQLTISLI